ncbi:MAG: hypothetical protein O3A47_04520 [Chloroflexi bacterium]|nr:hypothetical protein [Chloroflexota bacterium]
MLQGGKNFHAAGTQLSDLGRGEELNMGITQKTVTVRFDPELTSIEAIKDAMERIGYETEEVDIS